MRRPNTPAQAGVLSFGPAALSPTPLRCMARLTPRGWLQRRHRGRGRRQTIHSCGDLSPPDPISVHSMAAALR